jgi:hypothetical protein
MGTVRPAALLALAGVLALAGCGGSASPAGPASPAPSLPAGPTQARAQLAARAAAAQDRHMTATYRLSSRGHPARTVSVTLAADGGWRVDVTHGALGGTADVSVVRTADGLYQCGAPGCVRVAGRLKAAYDPRVQHPFTDWLAVLTDEDAALAVSPAKNPQGVRGQCYSVESSSASLAAPLDLGVYCYAEDGTLTGATLGFGTLVLEGDPAQGPASVQLPGPVVGGNPLPMAAPPSPSPLSGSPSP